jgi:RNA polymerase sigma-70 factor (ECF subfamily)
MPDLTGGATDLELLERTRTGDQAALGTILERYWAPVARYAASLLDDADAAEDAAQECFVRLWEHRESWTLEGSLRGLLFQIARNLAFDERRRTQARARAAHVAPEAPPPRTPADQAEAAELRALLATAVRALPERRREVFLLVRHQGLSHREVAQLLGLSPQTVANHLSLALTDLRVALASARVRPGDW